MFARNGRPEGAIGGPRDLADRTRVASEGSAFVSWRRWP